MTTRTVDGSGQHGFRRWAGRHPISAFLALLFSIGYPVMALPILASHGVIPGATFPGRLGLDTERLAVLLMMYGVMIPSALWVTWAADGRAGLQRLVARACRWRFGVVWWFAILGVLPGLTIGIAVLLGDALKPLTPAVLWGELVGLLVGFILINIWEEAVWAGIIQTRLEVRHNMGVAAALTALPFVLIHMPFQFIGEFSVDSVFSGFVTLLLFSWVFRLMLGLAMRGTGDSLFAVGLLHTMFNRSNNTDGIVAHLVDGDGRVVAALLATVILTGVLAVALRRQLGRDYRARTSVKPTPVDSLLAPDSRVPNDGVGSRP